LARSSDVHATPSKGRAHAFAVAIGALAQELNYLTKCDLDNGIAGLRCGSGVEMDRGRELASDPAITLAHQEPLSGSAGISSVNQHHQSPSKTSGFTLILIFQRGARVAGAAEASAEPGHRDHREQHE
jgi:hypothetical protein